jgi:RNA polymerase sigma-70 factor (sigma-E family)
VTERWEQLADLYEQRHREAVRLAWALCHDDVAAEELAQEAFVRVFLRPRTLRDPAAAPAYLRRAVVNLAFDRSRRIARERDRAARLAGVGSPSQPDPDAGLDLLHALARLPERRRACVVLRYYLDLTEADTAAALGVSVGTVKSQTHKALLQLRATLEPAAPPPPGEVPAPAARPDGRKD